MFAINSTLALYTHCFVLRTKGVLEKFIFRVDLIFEVEKLEIFQLQKLNQPILSFFSTLLCAA
jgi:hypothetical protein